MVSLALRSGIDIDVIEKQLIGISGPAPVWHNGEQILSTPDGIGKILKRYYGSKSDISANTTIETKIVTAKNGAVCPKCNGSLIMQEGCMTCPSCGYSKCS